MRANEFISEDRDSLLSWITLLDPRKHIDNLRKELSDLSAVGVDAITQSIPLRKRLHNLYILANEVTGDIDMWAKFNQVDPDLDPLAREYRQEVQNITEFDAKVKSCLI